MDVDQQHEKPAIAPKCHDILWFPDGNVVLATDTHLFKVHKSLLSLHSSVFKDMFELPDVGHESSIPEGPGRSDANVASDLYEGVPMVTLVGDKGEDVAHLLRAVFEPNYYNRDDDNTQLEVIVALLLLSTKYDFYTIRKNVVLHISRNYPKTLQEYDALHSDNLQMFGKRRVECHFPLLAAAVTADVDVLLPNLYLACSEFSLGNIFHRSQSMTRETLRSIIDAREGFAYARFQIVDTLSQELRTMDVSGECQNETPCLQDACFVDIQDFVQLSLREIVGEQVVKYYLSSVCKGCGSFVARMVDEERKKKWDEVPLHFNVTGVTDWKDVQAKLKAVVES